MHAAQNSSKVVSTSANSSQTKEIFIVEDDRIISNMLRMVLKRKGYSVQQFFDGNEAMEAIKMKSPPDMILIDIVLPYIDGYRILGKVCAMEEWKDVAKVMVTSNSNEANIVRAFEMGADEYITKPIQIDELVVRVSRFLR